MTNKETNRFFTLQFFSGTPSRPYLTPNQQAAITPVLSLSPPWNIALVIGGWSKVTINVTNQSCTHEYKRICMELVIIYIWITRRLLNISNTMHSQTAEHAVLNLFVLARNIILLDIWAGLVK